MMKTVSIIGSGFSSLSAACYLAQSGFEVHVYEKNQAFGGRARQMTVEGFTFDMGPSWYWMPDVFESFFNDFGKKPSDYYELVRLSPSYKVFFENKESLEIPTSLNELVSLFENIETGSGDALKKFLKKAKFNYEVAVKDLIYKPGISALELVNLDTIRNAQQFVRNIRSEIYKNFENQKLRQILEFPVLFLGAKPKDTPAFYNFMNYADLVLGTWYPKGGMYRVIAAMIELGEELGVHFHNNANVNAISTEDTTVAGLELSQETIASDIVLSGADYHHTEQLLPSHLRRYSEKYWQSRTFAPSALLFYVGLNRKVKGLDHHNLFFDTDFDKHAEEIYDNPQWPEAPLFYANFPSITDELVAPKSQETGFFLIPLAPDLEDSVKMRNKYFQIVFDRIEAQCGEDLRPHITYSKSYCVNDFKSDYNSFKGNAYGMANTLRQTAFLRPGIRSSKVHNLYFTGQLTVPGPGVPPALISGKIAANQIIKDYSKTSPYAISI
ncbi:MAG: phytoene desaturase [Bacteroidia bacterium]